MSFFCLFVFLSGKVFLVVGSSGCGEGWGNRKCFPSVVASVNTAIDQSRSSGGKSQRLNLSAIVVQMHGLSGWLLGWRPCMYVTAVKAK